MQSWLKEAYGKIIPFGIRQDIKGYTRWKQYKLLRQRVSSDGYSLKPYDDLHCIFIHIPKTAGISVCQALFGCLGGGHLTARTYQVIFGAECYKNYFKFAFVRNPWDRLVSAYVFLKKGGLDEQDKIWAREHLDKFDNFQSFVMHGLTSSDIYCGLHFIPQCEYVVNKDNEIDVDFIGRFETLESDFEILAKRLGVSANLSKINHSQKGDYRSYYNDASAEVVAKLYSRDIELFDYSFDH
ncbi:sulfotransferase family 2 domain-containing protein [Nitrosomonas supralitoralis]|uniref:Sulfotransferase family protein n=1 Tax=Nitrosomonas supralitoralis TaxID=2116706 RepID=A0A2P7NU91_9PROT|nr:sulfotransferase family 2 domain-containing protein [Nitrosomonas supralitoralis]PSJ17036.1 hypothetical protein C7H79_10410 [Nitrosomonas supralitoralis]